MRGDLDRGSWSSNSIDALPRNSVNAGLTLLAPFLEAVFSASFLMARGASSSLYKMSALP